MNPQVSENYQYWRDNGGAWADEYSRRKTWMVLYHIQEIMLTEYVLRHAEGRERPLRVLEFGCGVGRHLKNLSRLSNVDVHGFDQSATMVEGCRRWADADFLRENIVVGEPTGTLPYPDASFDLVYSAEVLVHVRPEHLPDTLAELVRISRGHVLHIEPSPDFTVDGKVHDGCWNHDLPSVYRSMGRECESLGRGYSAHSAWRTVVGEGPVFKWKPELLQLYQSMEIDIDKGFSVTDGAKRDAEQKRDMWSARVGELEADLKLALESLRATTASVKSTGDALLAAHSFTAVIDRDRAAAEAKALEAASQHEAALSQLRAERDAQLAAARESESQALALVEARTKELAEAVAELDRLRRDRATNQMEMENRAKDWSITLDRLREEARIARQESAAVKTRHNAFMNNVRGHLRRP